MNSKSQLQVSPALGGPRPEAARELREEDLETVIGGIGLRKSAGGGASGVFFLEFVFKLV